MAVLPWLTRTRPHQVEAPRALLLERTPAHPRARARPTLADCSWGLDSRLEKRVWKVPLNPPPMPLVPSASLHAPPYAPRLLTTSTRRPRKVGAAAGGGGVSVDRRRPTSCARPPCADRRPLNSLFGRCFIIGRPDGARVGAVDAIPIDRWFRRRHSNGALSGPGPGLWPAHPRGVDS